MDAEIPATLAGAIASQSIWLQAWIMVLMAAHFLGLGFIPLRTDNGWSVRAEPIAIFASFLAAAMGMSWLYDQVGYVRLLGAAHLVFWIPVYVWVARRRKAIGSDSLFGKYLVAYLGIAGISLVIDAVDVVRYLAGDP